MTEDALRGLLVDVARSLVDRGLVIGSVGNVSARLDDRVLITPTRLPHRALEPDDLVVLDAAGRVLTGARAPSLEAPLHVAIYAARPDVGGVVHTHSPQATAWSCVADTLDGHTEDFSYHGIDPVRVCGFAPPGSDELARETADGLGTTGRAVLLRRHGTVAVGTGPTEALTVAEVVEHQATIAWLVRQSTTSVR